MNVLAARSLAATRLGLHAESRAARGVHRQPRFSGDGHTRHLFRPPFLPLAESAMGAGRHPCNHWLRNLSFPNPASA